MSLLSDYRIRIKSLLASEDVRRTLVDEGMPPSFAARVADSRAVIAQRSVSSAFVKPQLSVEPKVKFEAIADNECNEGE
jgi:hypothetical protein